MDSIQALHLTGAALLVSRDIKLLERPRQVSLVDSEAVGGCQVSWLHFSVLFASVKPVTAAKKLIEERTRGKSAMPEDAHKHLSKVELRDLIELLFGLKWHRLRFRACRE